MHHMYSVGLDEKDDLILYNLFILTELYYITINNKASFIIFDFLLNNKLLSIFWLILLQRIIKYIIKGNNQNIRKEFSSDIKESNSINDLKNTSPLLEIVFGSLLGDGKLEMPPRGKNARFGFTQGKNNESYFLSVLNLLSPICSGKHRENSYLDKRTGKVYTSLNFWSKALPLLNEFYYNFYTADKLKVVPLDLSLLTPLALAHWIMQDGSKGTCRGLYLCTDCYSFDDVKRLSLYLTDKYNIKSSIHKSNGNHRIYILAKSVEQVRVLVWPYMHNSMLYKLGL